MRILVVCTGNTCRSPMAEGFIRRFASQRKLAIEVGSAGVGAAGGEPAQPDAVMAARELGADIRNHKSRPATAALIEGADLVLAMTSKHVARIRELVPAAAGRTHRFTDYLAMDSDDIVDPIGRGIEFYRTCAKQLNTLADVLTTRVAKGGAF